MILVFDVAYQGDCAHVAAVECDQWADAVPTQIHTCFVQNVAPYESGQFYRRELPCIQSLLTQIHVSHCDAIVVDGYVVLDDEGRRGLGAYLYDALDKKTPVIGVAKTSFEGLKESCRALLRGNSRTALYVTAQGVDLDVAHKLISQMAGPFRIPTLLTLADQHARKGFH